MYIITDKQHIQKTKRLNSRPPMIEGLLTYTLVSLLRCYQRTHHVVLLVLEDVAVPDVFIVIVQAIGS